MAVAFIPALANYLGSVGYGMPNQNVSLRFASDPRGGYTEGRVGALSSRDGITFSDNCRPFVKRLSKRYGKRGQLGSADLSTLTTVIHEMLHQPLMQRTPDWYGHATKDQRLWEEAAAQQGAQDLLAPVAFKMFGSRVLDPFKVRGLGTKASERSARMKAYRQWSTLASGSRNYRDPAARRMRRKFQTASPEERAQMLAAPPLPRPKPLPKKHSRAVSGPDRPPGY